MFFDLFALIARATEGSGLWHEDDGFFYDRLVRPDGTGWPIAVRSMSGLVPVFAAVSVPRDRLEHLPRLRARVDAFLEEHGNAAEGADVDLFTEAPSDHGMLALVDRERLRRIMRVVGGEGEMLSPHGVRAVSAAYRDHPFVLHAGVEDETEVRLRARRVDDRPVRRQLELARAGVAAGELPAAAGAAPLRRGGRHHDPLRVPRGIRSDRVLHRPRGGPRRPARRALPAGCGRAAGGVGRRPALRHATRPGATRSSSTSTSTATTAPASGASHQTGWTGLLANLLLERIRDRSGEVRRRTGRGVQDRTADPHLWTARDPAHRAALAGRRRSAGPSAP